MKHFLREAAAIAAILTAAVILFLALYGAATLLSPLFGMELRPSASSEFANWIQAVGSIVAIAGSYFIGARQARDAKDAALALYHLDRKRMEEGCRAIVQQMAGEISSMRDVSLKFEASGFCSVWQTYLKSAVRSALQNFDNMPIHEIGSYEAIQHAFELRAHTGHITARVDEIVEEITPPRAIAKGKNGERTKFDAEIDALDAGHKARLRTTIQDGLDRAHVLCANFERALAR